MLTARISKEYSPYVGERWICRLYEPGGNVWHGQVAHVSLNTGMTADQFAEECRRWIDRFSPCQVNIL